MNLIIDAGNTVLKAAVADGTTLGKIYRYQGENRIEYVRELSSQLCPDVLVMCSARVLSSDDIAVLETLASKLVIIDPEHKDIAVHYGIPEYLTPDSIACVKAARSMFAGKGCNIFDFGTTLNSIFIGPEGNFEGSTISPGCTTRFRSISRYARNLPLLSECDEVSVTGDSIESSIRSGVVSGIMFEIEGFISLHKENVTIFTGGDANYFAKRTKSFIFVICNFVLMGLAIIAQENE